VVDCRGKVAIYSYSVWISAVTQFSTLTEPEHESYFLEFRKPVILVEAGDELSDNEHPWAASVPTLICSKREKSTRGRTMARKGKRVGEKKFKIPPQAPLRQRSAGTIWVGNY
jgi:hypothetical protein